jgi:hypothetical protein
MDRNWCLYLPPHPTPGPGPQFIVSTLEEAVSFTLFAYSRRLSNEDMRKEFEHAHHIYREWLQEQDK